MDLGKETFGKLSSLDNERKPEEILLENFISQNPMEILFNKYISLCHEYNPTEIEIETAIWINDDGKLDPRKDHKELLEKYRDELEAKSFSLKQECFHLLETYAIVRDKVAFEGGELRIDVDDSKLPKDVKKLKEEREECKAIYQSLIKREQELISELRLLRKDNHKD